MKAPLALDSDTPRHRGIETSRTALDRGLCWRLRPSGATRARSRRADSHRLRLLRRQPARHAEGLQVAAPGAARPAGPRRAHLPDRVGDVDDVKLDEISRANVLVLDMMNQQMLERFNADAQDRSDRQVRGRAAKCSAWAKGCCRRRPITSQGAIWDETRAQRTGRTWAASNQVGLLKYALTQAGVSGLSLPQPQPSLDFGYYYPDGPKSAGPNRSGLRHVGRVRRVAAAARQARGPARRASRVSFYKATVLRRRDRAARRGHRARSSAAAPKRSPIFGYPGEVAAQRLLLDADGTPRADVVARLQLQFLRTGRVGRCWRKSTSRSSI